MTDFEELENENDRLRDLWMKQKDRSNVLERCLHRVAEKLNNPDSREACLSSLREIKRVFTNLTK